jgi:hypothetical protein
MGTVGEEKRGRAEANPMDNSSPGLRIEIFRVVVLFGLTI